MDDFQIVDTLEVVADLDTDGKRIKLAAGGRPGLGSKIMVGKTTQFGSLMKHMVTM